MDAIAKAMQDANAAERHEKAARLWDFYYGANSAGTTIPTTAEATYQLIAALVGSGYVDAAQKVAQHYSYLLGVEHMSSDLLRLAAEGCIKQGDLKGAVSLAIEAMDSANSDRTKFALAQATRVWSLHLLKGDTTSAYSELRDAHMALRLQGASTKNSPAARQIAFRSMVVYTALHDRPEITLAKLVQESDRSAHRRQMAGKLIRAKQPAVIVSWYTTKLNQPPKHRQNGLPWGWFIYPSM